MSTAINSLPLKLDGFSQDFVDATGNVNIPAGKTFSINGVPISGSPVPTYKATLTQAGTAAPVATVLVNTLGGTVVWTRQATGAYLWTLAGITPDAAKVLIFTNAISIDDNTVGIQVYSGQGQGNNGGGLSTFTISTGIGIDSILDNDGIEIEIYP